MKMQVRERGDGDGERFARGRGARANLSVASLLSPLPVPTPHHSFFIPHSFSPSYPAQIIQFDVQGGALAIGDGLLRGERG